MKMKIKQYVMAYGVEHDRLRAILPEGFISLRPVLRINAEIRDENEGYLEFNTAVERDGLRGWLNIGFWEDVRFHKNGNSVTFDTGSLEISFTRTGFKGSCPAEKDDAGCFFIEKRASSGRWSAAGDGIFLREPEIIKSDKEFCDCSFRWKFTKNDAHGSSIGKTLPAVPEEITHTYPKEELTAENAAKIPCRQVLGTYTVVFERR